MREELQPNHLMLNYWPWLTHDGSGAHDGSERGTLPCRSHCCNGDPQQPCRNPAMAGMQVGELRSVTGEERSFWRAVDAGKACFCGVTS